MFIKGFQPKTICQIKANLVHFIENYSLNDPTTPDLKIKAPLPSIDHLKYAVKDMSIQPKAPNEIRAANCFLTVGTCISNTQTHLNSPLKKWAACNILQVNAAAGSNLNAYYDRSSIKLFYYNFNGKNFYFGDSADIITHELGHAFLDAMRPDFWSVQSLEIWSFHEAFSDILALFNLMSYDVALNKVLEQTKGNLLISNSISRLAEEVGILIRNVTKDETYLPDALRDPAVEYFKYVDPLTLPEETDNNKLAAECHSFGRVFSNAWYHIFVRIFNYHVSSGMDLFSSIKKARDVSFSSLIQAIPHSPRVTKYYEAIAKCMIATANAKNPVYGKIVKDVFVEWNIIEQSSLRILSDISWKEVVRNLKKEDLVFKNRLNTIVAIKENRLFSVSDLPLVSNLSINQNFKVEVASDSYYEFDNKGFLSYEVKPTEEEIKQSAAQCITSIFKYNDKMWKIENNRLLRNFIS